MPPRGSSRGACWPEAIAPADGVRASQRAWGLPNRAEVGRYQDHPRLANEFILVGVGDGANPPHSAGVVRREADAEEEVFILDLRIAIGEQSKGDFRAEFA